MLKKIIKSSHNNICGKCFNTCYTNDIDKVIQNSQLSVHDDTKKALEWIPYDRLYNFRYIANDEFGKVYIANWIYRYIKYCDNKNQNWEREDYNMLVILKSLNNSDNSILEFRSKV
jgi:hypothetical protein